MTETVLGTAVNYGISVYNTTVYGLFASVELGATYHTDYMTHHASRISGVGNPGFNTQRELPRTTPPFLRTQQKIAPSPIAVQCLARSKMGTAILNPDEMSFRNFAHVSSPQSMVDDGLTWTVRTVPFGRGVWLYLFAKHETIFAKILDSTNTPAPMKAKTSAVYSNYL
ncbi:hypothetical protein BDW71DRAFT_208677 [Aspergillus fruticulosus]